MINPKVDMRVVVEKLGSTVGTMISQRHLDARKVGVHGTVLNYVGGHGGDLWCVRHDGSEEVGVYSVDEMKEEIHENRENFPSETVRHIPLVSTDAIEVRKLKTRINRAINVLVEAFNRAGGPTWKEAQYLLRADAALTIDYLTGYRETEEEKMTGELASAEKAQHMTLKEARETAEKHIHAPPHQTFGLTGWVCPKCGAVMSPGVAACVVCTPGPIHRFDNPGVTIPNVF